MFGVTKLSKLISVACRCCPETLARKPSPSVALLGALAKEGQRSVEVPAAPKAAQHGPAHILWDALPSSKSLINVSKSPPSYPYLVKSTHIPIHSSRRGVSAWVGQPSGRPSRAETCRWWTAAASLFVGEQNVPCVKGGQRPLSSHRGVVDYVV